MALLTTWHQDRLNLNSNKIRNKPWKTLEIMKMPKLKKSLRISKGFSAVKKQLKVRIISRDRTDKMRWNMQIILLIQTYPTKTEIDLGLKNQ
jgi:hypothetical protein